MRVVFIGESFDLHREQKTGCKKKFKYVKLDVNFRRDFFGGPEPMENNAENPLNKFAEKFVGNFPKIRQTKIKNSPQIRSAEIRDQYLWESPRPGTEKNNKTFLAEAFLKSQWGCGQNVYARKSWC